MAGKVLSAVYKDQITAQRVIHALVKGDILPRHDIRVEPVDPRNPEGKTRVQIWSMGSRMKEVRKIIDEHSPEEVKNTKGE